MTRPLVGVKLCGGCREQFNRIKAWEGIRTACPMINFVSVQETTAWDLILVLSGCPVQCPDVKRLEGTAPMLRVCSLDHIPIVIENLRRLTSSGDSPQPFAANAAKLSKE